MIFDLEQDNIDLRSAVEILEYPMFTHRATKMIGKPLQIAMQALPNKLVARANQLTQACLRHAFRVVLTTIDEEKRFQRARNRFHQTLVVTSGALGGSLGGVTAAIELPVSMGIMMRSIADVARSEGEDLRDPEARLACLSVLGLDTSTQRVTHAGSSRYFDVRISMASTLRAASEYLISNAIVEDSAPIMIQLLNRIAERFGVQLTEKLAAELLPVMGAIAGGTINYLFIAHFQRIARGHFIVRRLERKHGFERVQRAYEEMALMVETDRTPKANPSLHVLDVNAEVASSIEP